MESGNPREFHAGVEVGRLMSMWRVCFFKSFADVTETHFQSSDDGQVDKGS